ncbi:RHS repeat-associated core domain protein, partial [Catenibacterium mitsuokai DSM 15897]
KTEFKYDAQDRLVRVTDPKNLNTDYGYNGFGDQVRLSSPDTGVSTFTYDSAGARRTETDARGVVRTYGYDVLGRLTGISYSNSGHDQNVYYLYDTVSGVCQSGETFAVGRVTSMTDSSGNTQYCYDRFGRVVRKYQEVAGANLVFQYSYSLSGELKAITYPKGLVVTYGRDEQHRVNEVRVRYGAGAAEQVLLARVDYYPFGPFSALVYANGRSVSRTADLDYRISSLIDARDGEISFGLDYDALGNVEKVRSGASSDPVLSMGYDSLNRLKNVRDDVAGAVIESYAYDSTGNRTVFNSAAGVKNYVYAPDSHRLTEGGAGDSRSYDAAGNTIALRGMSLRYDGESRLTSIEAGAATIRSYSYNGLDERVYDSARGIRYAYGQFGQVLGAYGPTAGAQEIIWIDDVPVGLVSYEAGPASLLYIESDHLKTPRAIIDPVRDRAIWSWSLRGEAFGNSSANEDPDSDGIRFGFDLRLPGQIYDGLTGLHYNYYRNYDPAVGRYLESDPVGISAGPATYAYVEGRPL